MSSKKSSRAAIGNALIWASMIIASALLTKDSPGGETMMLILIAGWFASQAFVNGDQNAGAECAAIRRWWRRSGPSD